MAFCSGCGATLPDGATFCAACGRSAAGASATGAAAAPAPAASASGLTDNVAGALAYFFIPAIIFLLVEPYNKNRFIRFHSFQSLFLAAAWVALGIALGILGSIPFLGLLDLLIAPIVGLGGLVLAVVLIIKAYQGQMFKLPVIGDFAEKQA